MENLRVQLPSPKEATINTLSEDDLKARRQSVLGEIHKHISIPRRFFGKTLENYTGQEAKVKAAKEAILNGDSLFITGLCGTGKTHLACGLMALWYVENIKIEKDWNGDRFSYPDKKFYQPLEVCFLPSVELFLRLKGSFDSKTEDEESIVNHYSQMEFLVIDDLGAEKVSDWSRQIFYTLIDRRYRNVKQTIITSNLTLDEVASMIDTRISSRILEMGKAIKLEGADRRKLK